jgi:hypothetical protein
MSRAVLTDKSTFRGCGTDFAVLWGMTKKRFKLSMAALGLLAAFFMVLIAVLLAPTLASANKDAGASHHHGGAPDTAPPHGGAGGVSYGSIFTEDGPGHDHGNAFDTPFCAHGIYPCTDAGESGNGSDDAGGVPGTPGGNFSGGGNPHGEGGNGAPNGDGHFAPTFLGGGGGGGSGGGAGEGGGQGGDKACDKADKADKDESGNSDSKKDCDKTNSDDTNLPVLTLDAGGDLPSGFVDPFFGDDPTDDPKGDPKSGDGPTGDTPITSLAVTEVPEPLTLSLFAVGLAGAAGLRRRSQKARRD